MIYLPRRAHGYFTFGIHRFDVFFGDGLCLFCCIRGVVEVKIQHGFVDAFDEELAKKGPAAVFTVDHEGYLRVDVMRTRDFWNHHHPPFFLEDCHCVLRDRSTGWPQYALITSPELCQQHSRADIVRYPDQSSALVALEMLKKEVFDRNS